MSLELALSENTAAIHSLVAVWSKLVAQGAHINTEVAAGRVEAVTIPVVKPPKPVPTPTAPVTATQTPAVVAPAAPVAESPSDEAPSYEQVAEAIRKMVVQSRPRAIATLATFGAKKGTDLKPEQYVEFLKELAI